MKKYEIINMTPHVVNLYVGNEKHSFYPSGQVARVREIVENAGSINGFPAVRKKYSEIEGLPPEEETGDKLYIVSSLVLSLSERKDLIAPDTGIGSVVRDDAGNIIGIRRFIIK